MSQMTILPCDNQYERGIKTIDSLKAFVVGLTSCPVSHMSNNVSFWSSLLSNNLETYIDIYESDTYTIRVIREYK